MSIFIFFLFPLLVSFGGFPSWSNLTLPIVWYTTHSSIILINIRLNNKWDLFYKAEMVAMKVFVSTCSLTTCTLLLINNCHVRVKVLVHLSYKRQVRRKVSANSPTVSGIFINTYEGVNHSFLKQHWGQTEGRRRRYPSLLQSVECMPQASLYSNIY